MAPAGCGSLGPPADAGTVESWGVVTIAQQQRRQSGLREVSASTTVGAGRDWAWRARIRADPTSYRMYRIGVGVAGLVVVLVGLVLVPLPGPGWLIVFLGLAAWASEFRWAHRLHVWGRERLRSWERYVRRASWPVRLALLAGTGLAVAGCFWLLFFVTGLPAWLPTAVSAPLQAHLGL